MDASKPRNTENEFSRCRNKCAQIKSVSRNDRTGNEALAPPLLAMPLVVKHSSLVGGALVRVIGGKDGEHGSQVRVEPETYLRAEGSVRLRVSD